VTKQQKILNAAFEVFLRCGHRRARIDDIAGHAGMSRPALDLTFPNNEAVLARAYDEILRDIEAGLPAHASPQARLPGAHHEARLGEPTSSHHDAQG
jgi:AcrR family transcriptional regulator